MEDCVVQHLDKTSKDGSFTILQISDTHLFSRADDKLLGVKTADSFDAVLKAITKQNRDYEAILVTGDLSQDYTSESYRRFADMIIPLQKPVYWLPGNHDDGPLMRRIMPEFGISSARNIIIGDWQFVMLNTQVYSVPHGWILPDELNYLQECIISHPDKHTVICLHHNTFELGSAWLDQHELKNKEELLNVAYSNKNVKLILCGHVHQEHDFEKNGVRFISSPSTSIQFSLNSYNFSLDSIGPGWRYLTFYPNGEIKTEVHRLDKDLFVPDFKIGGY